MASGGGRWGHWSVNREPSKRTDCRSVGLGHACNHHKELPNQSPLFCKNQEDKIKHIYAYDSVGSPPGLIFIISPFSKFIKTS